MLIYLCLIIPLLTVAVLAVFFHRHVMWWEYLLTFGVPVIAIFIAKAISVTTQMHDVESMNYHLVRATYFEAWDEWIHKTCEHCTRSCTGSGEDERCTETCVSYDCSYRDFHPEHWEAYDNGNSSYAISRSYYNFLKSLWNNEAFQELNRHYYHLDGDAYNTLTDRVFDHVVPVCYRHSYGNKVQCSQSVFNFQDVDSTTKKEYGLYEYPHWGQPFDYNPILGHHDPAASIRLQRHNALLGTLRQVHMLMLVFRDQPLDAAAWQEAYWKGGNKNEFIACIGLKSNTIAWTKVISWTEEEELNVRVARKIKEMGIFNPTAIADTMAMEVSRDFIRKRFRDFDYITVEPTDRAVLITFIITILFCGGLAVFSIMNDYRNEG